ncbi:MAG: hypothetical protein ACTSUE_22955 [Promethearchaeota archaeon]
MAPPKTKSKPKTKTKTKPKLQREYKEEEVSALLFQELAKDSILNDLTFIWFKIVIEKDKDCNRIEDLVNIIIEYWILKDIQITIESKQLRLFGDAYFAIPFDFISQQTKLCTHVAEIIKRSQHMFTLRPNDPTNGYKMKCISFKYNSTCKKTEMVDKIVTIFLNTIAKLNSSKEAIEVCTREIVNTCEENLRADDLDNERRNMLREFKDKALALRTEWGCDSLIV